ncbi:short chain dehydrogenase family protein [Asticcacaulis biprosthecium C19]|uniref:Short chain dehydrogenase family protein n=1 Tax=Asticcacaulis biprosthecium C19 TaxID=715226 RepID=F4QK16_9CAUL|nr:SDR family oxidoreductase [Asticcacaulis biprosthecium]EGF92043.1 short chain dehydrogenase family protein [Asticcacaulis biprosthecium C19]
MARRLVLITGASSGIGLAFARTYAANGWDVAVTARRAERLEKLVEEIRLRFGVEAYGLPADLSDASAPGALQEGILALGRTVDGLVNNAGYGQPGGFVGNPWESHRAFMQVMMLAPMELTHRFLPGMIEQKFGRVVNVSSLAGFLPASPGDTVYGPVKTFLTRFSQSLHLEVRDHGVHVSALCPGWTYSEFHDVIGTRSKLSKSIPQWWWMGADEVAREGYQACEANRAACVPGAPNKTVSALLKVLPDDWVMELVSGQLSKIHR